jgi:hypothetical protein
VPFWQIETAEVAGSATALVEYSTLTVLNDHDVLSVTGRCIVNARVPARGYWQGTHMALAWYSQGTGRVLACDPEVHRERQGPCAMVGADKRG